MKTKIPTETNVSAILLSQNVVAFDQEEPPNGHKAQVPASALKMEEQYGRIRRGLLDGVAAYRNIGVTWERVKIEEIPRSELTIEQWVKKYLSFTQQLANRCAQLARQFDAFKPAHEWYEQSGRAVGWRTKRNTGVDYALDVIALHKKHLAGRTPTDAVSTKPQRTDSQRQIEKLECELSDREAEVAGLFEALERVCRLYQETHEGANFVEETLEKARLLRQTRAVAKDAGASGESTKVRNKALKQKLFTAPASAAE